MHTLIASTEKSITTRIQEMLRDRGWHCEVAETTESEALDPVLLQSKAEMVVVVLASGIPLRANLEKLRKQIRGKMVVVGPADPKIILGVLHKCSADEYVNIDDLESEFELVLRRSAEETTGKLIAVMSPSGGGGSTTLAVNLATVFAEKAGRSALLDLNLSAGDAAVMLNLKPVHSIADFAGNAARMDRKLFSQLLTKHKNGVELLASPLEFEDIPKVTADAARGAVMLAQAQFPYVIADVDQACSSEQIEVLKRADLILLVFALNFVSLHNLRRVLTYFGRCGIPRTHVRLVANRYGQTAEIRPSQVETALSMKIDFYLPEDVKDINRAENVGVPVVADRPRTKFSRSVNQMAAEINGVT